jgi:hypothetical protein
MQCARAASKRERREKAEKLNGTTGASDIDGKAASVAVNEPGDESKQNSENGRCAKAEGKIKP